MFTSVFKELAGKPAWYICGYATSDLCVVISYACEQSHLITLITHSVITPPINRPLVCLCVWISQSWIRVTQRLRQHVWETSASASVKCGSSTAQRSFKRDVTPPLRLHKAAMRWIPDSSWLLWPLIDNGQSRLDNRRLTERIRHATRHLNGRGNP